MDKKLVTQLHQEIKQALQGIAEEHNLVISINGGTFDPNEGWYKPKLILQSKEIGGVNSAKVKWDKWAPMYDLKEDDFGKTFQAKGQTWTIVGFEPSRSKYPVLVQNDSGKRVLYPVDAVKKFFGRLDPRAE